MADTPHDPFLPSSNPEVALLQHELSEAYKTIKALSRQLDKEEHRHAETVRAHKKTLDNLAEAGRERSALEHDRALWQARAEAEDVVMPFTIGGLTIDMTTAEVQAIRKAMERLYPSGANSGDAARLQAWNSALDPLEDEAK